MKETKGCCGAVVPAALRQKENTGPGRPPSFRRVQNFLRRVPMAGRERQRCENRLEMLRRQYRCVCSLREGGDPARQKALLAQLSLQEARLCAAVAAYWERSLAAEELLAALPDPRHREVLRLRYLESLSWPQVQEALQASGFWYEVSQLYRIHNAALLEALRRFPAISDAAKEGTGLPADSREIDIPPAGETVQKICAGI